ncbi:MAG TPA: homoserine kinase [Solirubrobacteraceae bacterium]|nr:homoserine kinase [Solirubrobacteraceae bacterium]
MPASVAVRVPASSANLGPGFDCFAAALGLFLELRVSESARFEIVSDLNVRRDRSNIAVAAFERLHDASGYRFELSSRIPLSGGLGSSAAAVVAGLLAASALSDSSGDLLALATEAEGHPDNAAAALLGGIVVCADGGADRIDPPPGVEALLVVPHRAVRTQRARAALPAAVPLGDAVFNTAHGALLMLGLATGDRDLIARGLRDRLHQPARSHLYRRSADLVEQARSLGALGATISGAGPTVLVWVADDAVRSVTAALRRRSSGWARVLVAPFTPRGAQLL